MQYFEVGIGREGWSYNYPVDKATYMSQKSTVAEAVTDALEQAGYADRKEVKSLRITIYTVKLEHEK